MTFIVSPRVHAVVPRPTRTCGGCYPATAVDGAEGLPRDCGVGRVCAGLLFASNFKVGSYCFDLKYLKVPGPFVPPGPLLELGGPARPLRGTLGNYMWSTLGVSRPAIHRREPTRNPRSSTSAVANTPYRPRLRLQLPGHVPACDHTCQFAGACS